MKKRIDKIKEPIVYTHWEENGGASIYEIRCICGTKTKYATLYVDAEKMDKWICPNCKVEFIFVWSGIGLKKKKDVEYAN